MRKQSLVFALLLSLFLPYLAFVPEAISQTQEKAKPTPTPTATPSPTPRPTIKSSSQSKEQDKTKVEVKEVKVVTKTTTTTAVVKKHSHKECRHYVSKRVHKRSKNSSRKPVRKKMSTERRYANENKLILRKTGIKVSDLVLSVPTDAQLTYLSSDAKQTINILPMVNGSVVPLKVRARIVSSQPVRARWESRADGKLVLEPKSTGTTKLIAWIPGTSVKTESLITVNEPTAKLTVTIPTPEIIISVSQTPTPSPEATATPNEVTVDTVVVTTPLWWIWWLALVFIVALVIAFGILLYVGSRTMAIAALVVALVLIILLAAGLI